MLKTFKRNKFYVVCVGFVCLTSLLLVNHVLFNDRHVNAYDPYPYSDETAWPPCASTVGVTAGTRTFLTLFTTATSSSVASLFFFLNTIRNWCSLGRDVRVIVFTDDDALSEACEKEGVILLSLVGTNRYGKPILKNMYTEVMQKYKSTFYAFVNSDVLFEGNLVEIVSHIHTYELGGLSSHVLMVGGSLDINTSDRQWKSGKVSWIDIKSHAVVSGRDPGAWFHFGMDYFITSENYPWSNFPDLVVGSAVVDAYVMWNARKKNHTTIDLTNVLLSIRQSLNSADFYGAVSSRDKYNEIFLDTIYPNIDLQAGRLLCSDYFAGEDIENKEGIVLLTKYPKIQVCCTFETSDHSVHIC